MKHARLIGIYNEAPTWKEAIGIIFVYGIPFAIIIGIIYMTL